MTTEVKRLDPKEIRKVRHKWEVPLFALCVIMSVFVLIIIAFLFIPEVAAALEDTDYDASTLIFMIIAIAVVMIVMMHYQYAQIRARSVRVTEKNFPEIYHKMEEFAQKLGMKQTPLVYIEQRDGLMNALANAILGQRRYSQISAEIVDIAYMENKDFAPAYFVLAHEFAHIYFNHVKISHVLLTFIGKLIPIFGPMYSRSREYSCDRLAQLLTESDGFEAMIPMWVGRHLYKYVDKEDYLTDKKDSGIFSWVFNLLASHPIPPKRFAALVDPAKKDGKLF